MFEYIKLHAFFHDAGIDENGGLKMEDTGKVEEIFLKHDSIYALKAYSDERYPYKTFVFIKEDENPFRVIETVEEIMKLDRLPQ